MKWNAVCHTGRFSAGSTIFICSSFLAFSSLRKMKDMASPMITEKLTAPTTRAIPISIPKMRAVRMIDKILIAGPESEECDGRPQSGSAFVYAGEQRQDGARTYSQNTSRNGGSRVG